MDRADSPFQGRAIQEQKRMEEAGARGFRAKRKEMMMSNQPENETQQPETVTPQEIRQSILADIDAYQQAIAELSDEELEAVAGGQNQRRGQYSSVGIAQFMTVNLPMAQQSAQLL
jgi:hypothetical protein